MSAAVDYLISYAQNFEDMYLSAFFPDVDQGFYVDIGANHPVIHSATKRFSLGGWRGINIEPIRRHWEALRLDRPDDINLQIGISNAAGELTFREYPGDGLSTFARDMMEYYDRNESPHTTGSKDYLVEVRTLRDVLTEHPLPHLHFMKVDIEGYEYEALEGNDWTKFRPEVLCIESNHMVRDWHPLVGEAGYQSAFFDGLNEYFVADEAKHRVELFRTHFPPWFVNRQTLRHPIHVEWVRREREVERLTEQLEAAEARIGVLSRRVRQLQAEKAGRTLERISFGELAREVDRRIDRRLGGWVASSRESNRARLESVAFLAPGTKPAQASAFHERLHGVDARLFSSGAPTSRLAAGSRRGYRVARRSAARALRAARGNRRATMSEGGK